jgi:Domain of unknown function (DUF4304)
MTSSLDPIFKQIVTATAQRLSQLGFKKNGNAFRLISESNVAIIEFQKSRDNTSERLLFTVNVAIVCGLLLDPERLTIQKSHAYDGHLRDRIGTFLPDRQDKWWEINNTTDEDKLSIEVSDLICDMAVPYLLRYVDTSELLALWESGRAPGLTEGARISKLETLKGVLAKGQA